jgi:hypothetical protein
LAEKPLKGDSNGKLPGVKEARGHASILAAINAAEKHQICRSDFTNLSKTLNHHIVESD